MLSLMRARESFFRQRGAGSAIGVGGPADGEEKITCVVDPTASEVVDPSVRLQQGIGFAKRGIVSADKGC